MAVRTQDIEILMDLSWIASSICLRTRQRTRAVHWGTIFVRAFVGKTSPHSPQEISTHKTICYENSNKEEIVLDKAGIITQR
jgi:hypothetical protein